MFAKALPKPLVGLIETININIGKISNAIISIIVNIAGNCVNTALVMLFTCAIFSNTFVMPLSNGNS